MISPRIAILSDLHCHPSTEKAWDSLLHCDAPRTPANKHPVEALLRQIASHEIRADVLLVPGDITNKANRQGLNSGWEFCREVAGALGAKCVIATPGNHDVDYMKRSVADPLGPVKTLHKCYPYDDEAFKSEFWGNGFASTSVDNLRILVINSVTQYSDKKEAKRGKITEVQLEQLGEKLRAVGVMEFQVVLMHHHPIQHEGNGLGADDLMVNGEPLLDLLSKQKFNLAIHGHKHYPRLLYAMGGSNSLPVFAAGSMAATSSRGILTNTRNLFHTVTLKNFGADSVVGQIRSWDFHMHKGWEAATVASADIPFLTGFGCRPEIPQLGAKIAGWFQDRGGAIGMGYFDWDEVVQAVPEVQFLIPRDLEALGGVLLKNFKIELTPRVPDWPERIGRLLK